MFLFKAQMYDLPPFVLTAFKMINDCAAAADALETTQPRTSAAVVRTLWKPIGIYKVLLCKFMNVCWGVETNDIYCKPLLCRVGSIPGELGHIYACCWCPGSLQCQAISRYDIDFV